MAALYRLTSLPPVQQKSPTSYKCKLQSLHLDILTLLEANPNNEVCWPIEVRVPRPLCHNYQVEGEHHNTEEHHGQSQNYT